MAVEVRIPTLLRSHADNRTIVEANGETLRELLDDLARQYPQLAGQIKADDGGLHKFINVYVNDDDVRYLNKLDTKVSDGDSVTILPAVAGGA